MPKLPQVLLFIFWGKIFFIYYEQDRWLSGRKKREILTEDEVSCVYLSKTPKLEILQPIWIIFCNAESSPPQPPRNSLMFIWNLPSCCVRCCLLLHYLTLMKRKSPTLSVYSLFCLILFLINPNLKSSVCFKMLFSILIAC